MLGLGARSKTPQNILREKECVLNLPSADLVPAVNRLARLTGSDPVPPHKLGMGYRYEPRKFEVAGLTPVASEVVRTPRILECAVQLEAVLEQGHAFGHSPYREPRAIGLEVRIVRAHIEESILIDGEEDRIDPDKWRPLIMSFRQFYGLSDRIHSSTLAEIPELAYRPNAHMM